MGRKRATLSVSLGSQVISCLYHMLWGTIVSIGVNLTSARRLKPQLHKRNLPAQVSKILIFRQSAQADLVFIAANSIRRSLN